ncbi:MAG: hypothetical protein LBQ51_02840 [Desulfovibrio sp.]|jgi:hypothetical protein|nr:hypothetical protein [Desulfovibrio sp.]
MNRHKERCKKNAEPAALAQTMSARAVAVAIMLFSGLAAAIFSLALRGLL